MKCFLSDYMIANAKSREERIVALDQAIDSLRYSYFGAISGIGLELKAHELVDADRPLTGHALNEIYCGMQKRFNGVDEGVTTFDESSCFAWINAPLYYDFYFYRYVTAVSAAGFFVEALEKRDLDARKRYFELLKAGGSEDPDILLKRAGFNAGSTDAYEPMVRRLERHRESTGRGSPHSRNSRTLGGFIEFGGSGLRDAGQCPRCLAAGDTARIAFRLLA